MSVYNSGSCRVRVGSAEIKGNSTLFTTFVSVGNIFKITGENVFYTIAGITSATKLTLSSRYANTNYQTARTEQIATAIVATNIYSGTLTNTPVIQNRAVVKVVAHEKFIDDGAGVLTGSLGGTGTVGYDDGAWSLILGAAVSGPKAVNASYYSGDTLDSQSYQIVKDYTTYCRLPEADPIDKNLAYIYTKAVRMIDSKLYNASQNSASIKNLTIHQSLKSKAVSKAASYVATSTNRWIVASNCTASIGIKLPNASVKNKFSEVYIINNSKYTVRVRRQNTDKINASSVIKLTNRFKTFHGYVATTGLWVRVQ